MAAEAVGWRFACSALIAQGFAVVQKDFVSNYRFVAAEARFAVDDIARAAPEIRMGCKNWRMMLLGDMDSR